MLSNKDPLSILHSLGLSEKEAHLYLKSLELDHPSSVGNLSKLTGINRATTYNILYELEKKGFFRIMIINEIIHFTAEPLSTLENVYETQLKDLKDKKEIIHQASSLFDSIMPFENNSVKMFRGEKEITHLNQTIPWESPYCSIALPGGYDPFFDKEFYYGRLSFDRFKETYARVLVSQTGSSPYYKKLSEHAPKLHTKIYTHTDPIPIDTMIFDSYVILVNLEKDNLHALKIENSLLADSYRYSFEGLWAIN